ncbi:MAG TPA: GtrA family protein [Bacilli bacterium]|jgi:putative flippase GtrA|nr:GtrA family protein [Bacilli bacterium]HPM07773.1 GtrA family protein [Bacilli bacterium]HPV70194.1 GtrA family protein [Bacilli bacterium]
MTSERKKEVIRAVKFLLFSISAGVVQILSFTLLNEVIFVDGGEVGYWLSYLIALVLSVIWNFTFNRRFTFKSASNVPIAMLLVFAYYAVFAPLSTLLEWWLCDLNGWDEYLVLAINMVINFVTEFLYQRFVVFRKSLDTNAAAEKEKVKSDSSLEDEKPVE